MQKWFALLLTLRGRLVLLVCLATLPALLFTFYIASRERTVVINRTEAEALQLAQRASQEHSLQLEGAKGLLHQLGRLLEDDTGLLDERLLAALLAGHPQLANIGVASPNGHVTYSAEPVPSESNLNDNVAFARALQSREVEIGDYVIGLVGRPVLHMACAVRGPNGAIRSVAFVAVDLRWLADLAAQADLPDEYSLVIADERGRVLAASGSVKQPPPDAVLRGLAEAATHHKTTVDIDTVGRRVFVAAPMRQIEGVSVIAGLPYERVYGEANAAFYRTAFLLGLLMLFSIASTLLAAEISVLRVLRSLSRTARLFGFGNLGARAFVPRGHGELTELAVTFNTMADALEARQREALETQSQLRALAHRLEAARETEAGRIARELHDEVGQVLTSVKLDLASMRRKQAPGLLDAQFAELAQRIDDAVTFVRKIASDLRPAVLDRLGLAAAVEWQAREFEARTGLPVVLEVDNVDGRVDSLVSITVFRIIQEALTNVARHANASHVSVELCGTADELVLEVRDDGKGIRARASDDPTALGILGMKERALLVGGAFEIEGASGSGTSIRVRIPHREVMEEHAASASG